MFPKLKLHAGCRLSVDACRLRALLRKEGKLAHLYPDRRVVGVVAVEVPPAPPPRRQFAILGFSALTFQNARLRLTCDTVRILVQVINKIRWALVAVKSNC